jgi:hypothetical protein
VKVLKFLSHVNIFDTARVGHVRLTVSGAVAIGGLGVGFRVGVPLERFRYGQGGPCPPWCLRRSGWFKSGFQRWCPMWSAEAGLLATRSAGCVVQVLKYALFRNVLLSPTRLKVSGSMHSGKQLPGLSLVLSMREVCLSFRQFARLSVGSL